MSNSTIVVSYSDFIEADFFREFLTSVDEVGVSVELQPRPVRLTNGVEWLLPTTVIILLTKPFFDAFMKRAADDLADAYYPRFKSAVAGLVSKVLVSTRDSWRRITSAGPLPREGRSSFLSIISETQESIPLRFVFDEELSVRRYTELVDQAMDLLGREHTDVSSNSFINAPLNGARNTIYMLYDEEQRCWIAADVDKEIRKIAEASIQKRKQGKEAAKPDK